MTATGTRPLAEPSQHAIDRAERRAVLQYAVERERDGNAGRHGFQIEFLDQRGYGEAEQQIGDAVAATVLTITGSADKRRGHVVQLGRQGSLHGPRGEYYNAGSTLILR